MSSNVAEYSALIYALQYLVKEGLNRETIVVRGDSALVIKQMSGHMRIGRKGLYRPFAFKAMDLVSEFSNIKFAWIPREFNTQADELSTMIIEETDLDKIGIRDYQPFLPGAV